MTIEEFLTEPGSWEMYPGASRAAKPRLRWRHSIDQWIIRRPGETDGMSIYCWDGHLPLSDSHIARCFA